MTQEQTPQTSLVSFFVNPTTFDLWERPASLLATPRWISFKLNDVFQLLRHLDSAETYLLLKRVYDRGTSSEAKEALGLKSKFLHVRAKAISLFGEASLLEASKKLKAEPERILEKPEGGTVQNASNENLALILPSAPPTQSLPTSTPSPEPRVAFRVPIADPDAVASCTTLITGILDRIRESYIYNAPRLTQLSAELQSVEEPITDDKLIAAMLIAAGPLTWIKNTRPELAMQIRTLENVLEQSAIMGALGPVEVAGAAFLAHWQKALRDWQTQVDLFFPTLNQEGGETK